LVLVEEEKMEVVTWADILDFPCIVMLAGRRRMGKSALGYYLLTLAQRLYDVDAYVKGLPREKWHLLPDYIHPLDPEEPDLPDSAAIFLDEAAMFYYARDFGTSLNKALSILLSISGQKDQLLIFATHYTRKIDIDIITDVDILAFKQPGMMYKRFERREMREFVKEVYEKFKKLPDGEDVRKYSYVLADTCDFEGFVTNPLPDFWSEELSKAFAGIKVEDILAMRKGGRGRSKKGLQELWCKFGVEAEEAKEV
jgi:hypothetical protein